jgi:hypothetical protein
MIRDSLPGDITGTSFNQQVACMLRLPDKIRYRPVVVPMDRYCRNHAISHEMSHLRACFGERPNEAAVAVSVGQPKSG